MFHFFNLTGFTVSCGCFGVFFLLICNTGRLNSALSDSPGHGRVVPTATDRHFWEQGAPNGTAGISSIFTYHLDTEATRPSRGVGRRTASQGQGVCNAGIRIVYTLHIGGKLGRERTGGIRGVHTYTTTCVSCTSIFIIVAKIVFIARVQLLRRPRPRLIFFFYGLHNL